MKIPLPFPRCKKCGENADYSFHRSCGGKLDIETTSDEVYCRQCGEHWYIWDSNYYCSCGNEFKATEVRGALTEVLVCCRVCAKEIAMQQEARKQRITKSRQSLKIFIASFFEKLGYSFGVATGTIIDAVLKYVLKKI